MNEKTMITAVLLNQILMMKVMEELLMGEGVTAFPSKGVDLFKELDKATKATKKVLKP